MAFLPLAFPPGVARRNTEAQAAGRYWDAHMVRAYGAQVGPVGGSKARSEAAVSGKGRAMLAWRANNGARHIAIGTHTGLWTQTTNGVNFDITPEGFVAGVANSGSGQGYGGGAYGTAAYGVGRPDIGVTSRATVWDLDTFGQDLVALSPDDGVPYVWELDVSQPAAPVPNAPVGCSGLCVTAENALMVFGANGNGRNVAWSDIRDITVWTPDATNQAGDFDLVTKGEIRKGLRLEGSVLILTDFDAWRATYAGALYVYGFEPVGHGCGVLSKGAAVAVGQQAFWWSDSGFWFYDGQACTPIECELHDLIKFDVNLSQAAKITGFHNTEFGEIVWDYPSSDSLENDRRIRYNYRTGEWWTDRITRLASCEKGPFRYPMSMGDDGLVYEHERGSDYGPLAPYVETGPIAAGAGEVVLEVNGVIGDEKNAGGAQVGFFVRDYPNAEEVAVEPVALAAGGYSEARFAGRLSRMRITFSDPADRFGMARLDYEPGGGR